MDNAENRAGTGCARIEPLNLKRMSEPSFRRYMSKPLGKFDAGDIAAVLLELERAREVENRVRALIWRAR